MYPGVCASLYHWSQSLADCQDCTLRVFVTGWEHGKKTVQMGVGKVVCAVGLVKIEKSPPRSPRSPRASDRLTRRREGAEIRAFFSEGQTLRAIRAHPRVILQHVRAGTPAPHSSSQVRVPPARISAASAPGARASGAQARRPRSQEARGSIMLPGAPRPSPAGASRRSARASARSLPLARAGGLRLAWPRALARRHEAYTG